MSEESQHMPSHLHLERSCGAVLPPLLHREVIATRLDSIPNVSGPCFDPILTWLSDRIPAEGARAEHVH